HIGPAAPAPLPGRLEVGVLALGAAVVGGQGVDLGDARHEGHQGGTHAAPGAHQVAVVQGVLHQLLGGHVDHVVLALDDIPQLGVDAVHHDLGGLFSVEGVGLVPHQAGELLSRVFDLGGEEALGEGNYLLAPVGHQV